MSNNGLGDSTGVTRTRTVEAEATVSAGDALAINQSASADQYPIVAPGDTNDANLDEFAAVAAEDISSGSRGTAVFEGPVIAFTNGSVVAGMRLGLGDASTSGIDAGELVEETGNHILALSDDGGTDSAGTNLSAGEGEVYL
jgi:hypothetical protein